MEHYGFTEADLDKQFSFTADNNMIGVFGDGAQLCPLCRLLIALRKVNLVPCGRLWASWRNITAKPGLWSSCMFTRTSSATG